MVRAREWRELARVWSIKQAFGGAAMKKSVLTKGILGVVAILSCLLGSGSLTGAADYLVRPDDKLRIKIFQFPELSGDYTVSTNGTVLIPPIGELNVAGSSAIDISSQISKRFIAAGISD